MSYSILTMLTRNLHEVFGEREISKTTFPEDDESELNRRKMRGFVDRPARFWYHSGIVFQPQLVKSRVIKNSSVTGYRFLPL